MLDPYTPLIQFYAQSFLENKSGDQYMLLCSSVFMDIMGSIYKRLVAEKEIKPIEELPLERKEFYWNVAARPNIDSKEKRIKAAIAAYTINIVVGNDN